MCDRLYYEINLIRTEDLFRLVRFWVYHSSAVDLAVGPQALAVLAQVVFRVADSELAPATSQRLRNRAEDKG